MSERDRLVEQPTRTGQRTRSKLLLAGAFLLAVLAASIPGSDKVALADTANVNLFTSADNAPIPLNGLYDTGVTLVYAIDNTTTVIAISNYKPLKIGLAIEVDWELMTITDLAPGAPATMTVERPDPTSHAANTHVWANAAPVQVLASGIGERDTGTELAAGINTNLFEASGAMLIQAVDAVQQDLTVSDWSVLYTERTAMVGSEKMYINSVDAGFWGKTGATVAAYVTYNPPNPDADPIAVSDQSKLGVGWIVQVESEKMLISALDEGSPDTMTVQRGYDGTTIASHSSGAIIRHIRATLADDVAYQTEIPISNKDLLAEGQTVRVGLELMHIEALSGTSPPYTMTVQRGYSTSDPLEHESGEPIFIDSDSDATIAGLDIIDDEATSIPISDKDLLAVGQTVRVELELMEITGLNEGSPDTMDVIRGCPPSSAASHMYGAVIFAQSDSTATPASDVASYATVIPISSKDLLQVGWVVSVGDENMRITALEEGSPDTMTVERGYNNTSESTYVSGQAVYSGPDRITVQRGYDGTTPAAHSAYTPIYEDLRTLIVDDRSALKKDSTIRVGSEYMSIEELPEEENTIRVSRGEWGSTPASHSTGDPIFDPDGLGAYQFTVTVDSAYLEPVYARDGDLQGITFVGSIEIGTECSNAVDDDGDWKINDGCPASGVAETGTKCNNAVDDDGDGKINDGCPGRTLYPPSLQVTDSSLQFSQATTGTEPGATGSGTLATLTLWAKQLTPGTSLDLAPVTLSDVSVDVIPSAPQDRQVKIVKCPDVDPEPNRVVNINDVYGIAGAAFPPGQPLQPKYDIDSNQTVNIADVYIAAAFFFLGPTLHCAVPSS